MTKVDHLTLTAQLEPEDLEILMSLGERRAYRDGQTIYEQGDDLPGLSLVLSGHVKLFRSFPDGRMIMEAILKPGQHFDDSVVLGISPRLHYSKASGATVINHYSREALECVLAHPRILRAFFNVASYRVYTLVELLDDTRTLSPEKRLGKLLLYLHQLMSAENGSIDCLQEELAARLGVSGVTLAKALSKLKQAGLVRTGYRSVVITDMEGLHTWACDTSDE